MILFLDYKKSHSALQLWLSTIHRDGVYVCEHIVKYYCNTFLLGVQSLERALP